MGDWELPRRRCERGRVERCCLLTSASESSTRQLPARVHSEVIMQDALFTREELEDFSTQQVALWLKFGLIREEDCEAERQRIVDRVLRHREETLQ